MTHVAALQDTWLGVDMNVDAELLWPGAALLLLLGTVAGLCVRCSRPGNGAVGDRGGPTPGCGGWTERQVARGRDETLKHPRR